MECYRLSLGYIKIIHSIKLYLQWQLYTLQEHDTAAVNKRTFHPHHMFLYIINPPGPLYQPECRTETHSSGSLSPSAPINPAALTSQPPPSVYMWYCRGVNEVKYEGARVCVCVSLWPAQLK